MQAADVGVSEPKPKPNLNLDLLQVFMELCRQPVSAYLNFET